MLVIENGSKKWQKDFSEEIMPHYPVMYREVIDYLKITDKKVVVDCTLGMGSHAARIIPLMGEDSLYIGIDKDADSLAQARERLSAYQSRTVFIHDDFRHLSRILDSMNINAADAVLMDLGISMRQLTDPERGFSFAKEGPLDMRMDKQSFLCASDLVNNLSEQELSSIFEKFGEERYSRRIARMIVRERAKDPIATTTQLRDLILHTVPLKSRRFKLHPATRVFQALRIAVNRELDSLETGISEAIACLNPGGRLAAISFHSLEDRIVKHTLRRHAQAGELALLTRKPLTPGEEELKENSASRSAKLRAAERI